MHIFIDPVFMYYFVVCNGSMAPKYMMFRCKAIVLLRDRLAVFATMLSIKSEMILVKATEIIYKKIVSSIESNNYGLPKIFISLNVI